MKRRINHSPVNTSRFNDGYRDYDPIKGYEENGDLYGVENSEELLIDNPFPQLHEEETLNEKINHNPN